MNGEGSVEAAVKTGELLVGHSKEQTSRSILSHEAWDAGPQGGVAGWRYHSEIED